MGNISISYNIIINYESTALIRSAMSVHSAQDMLMSSAFFLEIFLLKNGLKFNILYQNEGFEL